MAKQPVIVVPYDPAWPAAFARAAADVRAALGENLLEIHHVGSTSVPGIFAKPIIDMLAVVGDLAAVDAREARMRELGYVSRGEHGIPGRRFLFRNDAAGVRTHQVHAFEKGSPHVGRHLAFRDFLRARPDVAAAYGDLKRRLADAHPDDIEAYMDGKDAFIKEMEAKALAWAARSWRRFEPMPRITAEVVFLLEGDGGRAQLPAFSATHPYMPHIVVQTRSAPEAAPTAAGELYQGVAFVQPPVPFQAGVSGVHRIDLMYYPDVSYADVKPGATFTVREGGKVVGHGTVLTRADPSAP